MSWEASPRQMTVVGAFELLTGLIPPAVVVLGKRIVDFVAAREGVTLSDVVPTIAGLGVLLGGQRALNHLQHARQELFSTRVQMTAERRFLAHVAGVDLGHYDNSDWHDRVARAKRDITWRPYQLSYTVLSLGGTAVTALGMLSLLFSLHPILVVLSLSSIVPSLIVQQRVSRRLYRFHFETTPDDRERDYMSDLVALPRAAKELRAFGLGPHLLGRHRAIADSQYRKMRLLYGAHDRYTIFAGAIGGLALASAYAFVVSRGLAGLLTPGALTLVTGAFVSVAGQFSLMTGAVVRLDQHAQFLDDYFTFLQIPPLIRVPEHPVELPSHLGEGIEFQDASFTYPGATEPALAGLTLSIRPGELLALVGENGAGKTTLVKLLLRFYDASSGSVRVGGVDLRDVDPVGLRARIGVLFQDFAQYELSVRENVTLGRTERDARDEDITAALHAARAEFLLKTLPNGLDSKVGRLFDGGHDLSGGEWQRLALARLMYRDADVWILDEPTSSLDPEAEAGIFAELRENLRDRIGIVISHRFSTVRIADRIAVVQDGRVSELGTHEELLALSGRYAELFELQAAGYR